MNKNSFDDYFIRFEDVDSQYVQTRHVDVLLPSDYYEDENKRYPVLYMHDGQNLFDDSLSFSGVSWGVGETMHDLSEKGEIPKTIVVGIWNNEKRLGEYMPQRPLEQTVEDIQDCWFTQNYDVEVLSDKYLKFIAEEVKPLIDNEFRTMSDKSNTSIMGSSMGGLISMYAICEYPNIFNAAGCLSSSWTVIGESMMGYLKDALPEANGKKIYVDYGVEEFVGNYKHYIKELREIALSHQFEMKKNWLIARFPGAEHSEQAWKERLDIPLKFLLNSTD